MLSGWLIIDKPEGMTSTRVGTSIKRALGKCKLGHIGTLDPMATGVLVVAIGEATKLIPYVTKSVPSPTSPDEGTCLQSFHAPTSPDEGTCLQKEYTFCVKFGQATDSYDADGSVTDTTQHLPTSLQLIHVCKSMLGPQDQRPPCYSAIKHNGRRLCDLARKGQTTLAPIRQIHVYELEPTLLPDESEGVVDRACFRAVVSGGTYIRSIAHDLAIKAHSLGHVVQLRRTRDGQFNITQAITLEKVLNLAHKGYIGECIVPIGAVLGDIPAVSVSEQEWKDVLCGRTFPIASANKAASNEATPGEAVPNKGEPSEAVPNKGEPNEAVQGIVQVLYNGTLIAMGHVTDGVCFPRRVLHPE
ncbi:MAG: tRNA pseudouridine(55) synthase TruB [Holosporales bacterium]|jgi:tRNA pseudouridine55 synthase|nr:tRNA pseudouridine(55) synthase TruB [Holosporales bacterium]